MVVCMTCTNQSLLSCVDMLHLPIPSCKEYLETLSALLRSLLGFMQCICIRQVNCPLKGNPTASTDGMHDMYTSNTALLCCPFPTPRSDLTLALGGAIGLHAVPLYQAGIVHLDHCLLCEQA